MNLKIESLMNLELLIALCIAVILILIWVIKCKTDDEDHEFFIPSHAGIMGLMRDWPSSTPAPTSQPPSGMNVVVNIYSERNPVETLACGGDSTAVKKPAGVEGCPICLSGSEEDDEPNQWVALPGCKHWFHSACIYAWFSNHKTCPLCREPFGFVWKNMLEERSD